MKPLKILSVDWDWFFPNINNFDWGVNEKRGFYYELVWFVRYHDINLRTKKTAHEEMNADADEVDSFWSFVLKNQKSPPSIIVSDSHMAINMILTLSGRPNNVWNFDQHHDCGYDVFRDDGIDCNAGNWALIYSDKIKNYYLIYPEWRFQEPENDPIIIPNNNIYYGIPSNLPSFDIIFLCRSSCWTPSWCDHLWLKLLGNLEKLYPAAFAKGIKEEYILRARNFDPEKAGNLQFIENDDSS